MEQGGSGLTLRRLSLWSIDPIDRLKLMAQLTQGAGTLQVIYNIYIYTFVCYTILHCIGIHYIIYTLLCWCYIVCN
jgi:hypothetical protein